MWQQEEYISKKEGPLPLKHHGTSKRMSPKTLGCNTDSQ